MSEGVDQINRMLVDAYGKDVGSNNPNFRIAWTTSQTEKKFGHYEDYCGDIWLREVTEVREVQKYPLYEDMWVLERLQPIPVGSDIKGANYSYEPIWVFGANNSVRQPVWRAVKYMCDSVMYLDRRPKLASDLQAEEDAKFLAEKAIYKDMLQDNSPAIPSALAAGEAVTVPHNYEKSNIIITG